MREQDLIIMLLILAVSGISTILQKWRQAKEQRESGEESGDAVDPGQPGRRATPPPVSEGEPYSLEEELRRILGGERPRQPEPPAPPPILAESRPAPPPVPSRPQPEIIHSEIRRPSAATVSAIDTTQAYKQVAQLQQAAASNLKAAQEATARARAKLPRRDPFAQSAAIRSAISLVRSPETTRQAFVASFILGPPKALERPEN